MKRFSVFAILALVAVFALNAVADDLPTLSDIRYGSFHGAAVNSAKARVDTIQIMGPNVPGAAYPYFGNFQTSVGTADWNDWTHVDKTDESSIKWTASTYAADNLNGHGAGNQAAWCGFDYAPCSATDVPGGYGDQWYSWIEFSYEVPDTNEATTVNLDFWANWDTEHDFAGTNYDVVLIVQWYPDAVEGDGHVISELGAKGVNQNVVLDMPYTANTYYYDADDNRNQVYLWILVDSDIWTSDENCGGADWTGGNGAIQIDDLQVTITNGASAPVVFFDDFEAGLGTNWVEGFDTNKVGDFSNLRAGLGALDDCDFNASVQANFVDTGFYTDEGLDPQPGITYTYGPSAYVVQNQGGLSQDESYHTYNVLWSPVMAWPTQDNDGALLHHDLYIHEQWNTVSAGMFMQLEMRSTTSADPADIEKVGFESDGFLYYGGPFYLRNTWLMSEKLQQGRTYVQIQLACWEAGYLWGRDGVDGTPAPYFDNVALWSFPIAGPAMTVRGVDLAQDNFPTIGLIDTGNLAANSVRFDMANNISPDEPFNDPGDSLVVEIAPIRTDATMARLPRMYFNLNLNPVFDGLRTAAPALDYVEGVLVAENTYSFDLPDENFLFPGDRLHYYFEGVDDLFGDQVATHLPADTTGFSNWTNRLAYPSDFVFQALPTLRDDGIGGYTQPGILFWNDFENRGAENEWHYSLNNIGKQEGYHYDTYYTHGASSGLGNGIGGRGTVSTIAGYSDLLYSSGTFSTGTISNGDGLDQGDAGDDVGVLTAWFELGGKDAFFTGNSLVFDLANTGGLGTFLNTYVGVTYQAQDIRPLIGSQAAPLILTLSSNPVFTSVDQWIAYGGCPAIRQFDAVYPAVGATRLAEFTNTAGAPESYDYSAATLFPNALYSSRVISMPYDLYNVYSDPNESTAKGPAGLSARARILRDVLSYFGVPDTPGDATNTPELQKFSVSNFPNPFNPTTKVAFNMPKAGHLGIKVYNVRGELVTTLHDGHAEQGPGFVMWDGTNSNGAAQASGVYFYEARTAGDVQVNKMALVK